MARPPDLKYTQTHEWARKDGDLVVVGITEYAVEQLNDITFVDLPVVGTRVAKGKRFGEIESTKTVADLIAPVDGVVVKVNMSLADGANIVETDPYGKGWMIEIRPDNAEFVVLMSEEEYKKFLETEG